MHTGGDGAFTRSVVKPILVRVLREAYADMRALEERVVAGGLEWTIVRPPKLTGGPRTGRVASSTDGNVRGSLSISRADLAAYLLRAAADDALIGAAVSVAKARRAQ